MGDLFSDGGALGRVLSPWESSGNGIAAIFNLMPQDTQFLAARQIFLFLADVISRQLDFSPFANFTLTEF